MCRWTSLLNTHWSEATDSRCPEYGYAFFQSKIWKKSGNTPLSSLFLFFCGDFSFLFAVRFSLFFFFFFSASSPSFPRISRARQKRGKSLLFSRDPCFFGPGPQTTKKRIGGSGESGKHSENAFRANSEFPGFRTVRDAQNPGKQSILRPQRSFRIALPQVRLVPFPFSTGGTSELSSPHTVDPGSKILHNALRPSLLLPRDVTFCSSGRTCCNTSRTGG